MKVDIYNKIISSCTECFYLQRKQERCPYVTIFNWTTGLTSIQLDCPFIIKVSSGTLKELGFEQGELPYQFFDGIYKLIRITDTKISITHVADDQCIFYGEIANLEHLKFILKIIS